MLTNRPIIWIAVCWIAGIACIGQPEGYAAVGIGLMLLFAAARLSERTTTKLVLICLAAYLIGGAWTYVTERRHETELLDLAAAADGTYPPVTYEVLARGVVASPVEIDGDSVRFRLLATSIEVTGEAASREIKEQLLVQLKLLEPSELSQIQRWRRGDDAEVQGQLELPAGPANEGGFDYRRYLNGIHHISWMLRTKGSEQIAVEPSMRVTVLSLLGRMDVTREWLGGLMDALYENKQSGYMKGLVLGINDDLDPDMFRQYSELGLTHVLAISGMHVAVFLAIVHGFLRLLRLTRERSLLILAWVTPMYVLLSGASPSIVRAGIMAIIGLLAARANRLKDGLHLLAVSAIIMLAWNPAYIKDIGFQLSFIVTAGLIVGVAPVRALMPKWRRGKMLLDAIAVTIVAQIVSFPVSIYYFNQWNPLSLPANFVLVPFISFIVMPLGAASLTALSIWPVAGHWLANVAEALNALTFSLVEYTAAQREWQTIWAKPPIWWVALWYAMFAIGIAAARSLSISRWRTEPEEAGDAFGVAYQATVPLAAGLDSAVRALRRRYRLLILSALIGTVLLLSFAWLPDRFQRMASISVLDVGQGDAILIRTGEGKHILIDGGGTVDLRKPEEQWRARNDPFEVGRKILVPLLKQRGIDSLDVVIMTHLDKDHIGGLQAVFDSIPVKAIIWNGTSNATPDAKKLLQTALALHIPMYPANANMSWRMEEGARLDVLWPEPPLVLSDVGNAAAKSLQAMPNRMVPVETLAELPNVEDQNERSVTLLLTLYGRTFLLPGDAGRTSELAMLEHLRTSCESIIPGGSERVYPPTSTTTGDDSFNHCIDVLKVGHHGSKNSSASEWLAYWRPAFAVVSAGKDNLYGHPHSDTLARLAVASTGVWRTDRDGELRFAVTPQGEMFVSWSRKKWKKYL